MNDAGYQDLSQFAGYGTLLFLGATDGHNFIQRQIFSPHLAVLYPFDIFAKEPLNDKLGFVGSDDEISFVECHSYQAAPASVDRAIHPNHR